MIKFLNTKSNETNLGFSLLSKVQTNNLLSLSYNFRLLFSGVSIQNTTNLNKSISKLKDSVLFDLFKNFKSNKSLISKTVSQPIAQRDFNIDSLIIVADRQEKKLIRSSADYRNSKDRLNLTWDKIRNNLKPNETSIEFVKFNYFDKSEEGINQYAAIILRPIDTVPIFVNLCNENQLKEALKQFAYKTSSNTRGNSNKSNAPSSSSSTDLYKLFWQPLEKYLTNTKTIYFAPDGLLHQIAFAAIPYAKDKLLSDKYNLVQVTSTRQVAIKGNSNQALTSIALFGGINYNKQTTDSFNSVVPDPYNYVYQQNRGVDIDSFKYLPNTFKEVNDIKANMDLQSKKVFLYNGANATEASFRKFSTENTSPSIIHFATHGFTLPNASQQKTIGETNVFKVSDNPLLRCGLVMAGGNKGWKGMSSIDEDDGILTGLEISNSSLQNTQLAVLSACETGTGELNGSEGVFGLQRAFKLAGVNYVMAALWQVPDKETAAFMNAFYKNLIGGKTIRQSFLSTQKFMRKKYSPYYWAAFTLVQ